MFAELRQALHTLAKAPGFVAVATLTLALGLGATTTFFSVLHGVVLQALPYPDSNALVELRNSGVALGSNGGLISLAELRDFRDRQRTLEGIGAYDIGRGTLSRDDGAERVIQTRITANLLPLLGVAPALGRGFTEAEEGAGRDQVLIVSHDFWQTHLGGTPDVLGHIVRLNNVEHTIVGVMPAGFSFGEAGTALWKPLDFSSRGPADRDDRYLSVVARLADGVSLARAQADFQRVAEQLRTDLPDAYPAKDRWAIELTSLRRSQFGHLLAPLGTLMAAAAAVLLIACVNVAIMFLLRAAVRRREMTIRLSLGASRKHIIRQLLAESTVVCALGAAGGTLIAFFGLQLLKTFPPADIPRLADVTLNASIAAFGLGILVLVTLVVGLAPAIAVLKTRITEGLTPSARTSESRASVRMRDALTVIEVALAVMLLVCGGLALRSFQSLLRDDVGFATQQLFTFKTNLTAEAYPDLARTTRFYDQVATNLEALPGVTSVAAISSLPLSGESQFTAAVPLASDLSADAQSLPPASWRIVRGPYFGAMGSTLLRGRFFDETDHASSLPVVIVNDLFARRFWPNEADALGQQVRFGTDGNAHVRTIVGVVHRVKHWGPGKDSLPEVYVPHTQHYQRGMFLVLKMATSAAGIEPLARAQLASVDPAVPMYFVETMEHRYARTLALPRFTAGLISAFSTLAIVLAGVGIFGVTAYAVSQRSREFGIRFAIGAPRSHVINLVLGRVFRLALLGGAIGAVAAYELASLMKSLLFGVEPADLPALAAAAAIIALTAVAASLVPLVRALRVNPADALRAE